MLILPMHIFPITFMEKLWRRKKNWNGFLVLKKNAPWLRKIIKLIKKIEEDVKVYNDVTKIVSILKKYVNISHILLDEYGVTTEIGKLQNVLSINNSNIELTVINEYKRRSVKFHCIVKQIEFLSDEECSLYTDISKDVPSGFNVIDTTRDLIQLIENPNESNSLYSAESKFIVLPIE